MERRNKKRILWGILLLFVFFLFYYLYVLMQIFSVINKTEEHSTTIVYEEVDQCIFVKSIMWGLLGNHYRIFFSDTDHTYPEEHDVIFYDSEIFYKSNGIDSLYIYKPSNLRKPEENRLLGKVKVKTITVVNGTQWDNYKRNFKNLRLSRISVYDGIESP